MEPLGHTTTSTTTILIRNLHCPSCVSNIEDSLFALSPKPISLSSSIVSQSVTIQHEASLPVSNISLALEEAGFDIDGIIQSHARDADPAGDLVNGKDSNVQRHSPEWPMSRWRSRGRYGQDEGGRERAPHIERCDLCRAEEAEGAESKPTTSLTLLTNAERIPRDNGEGRKRGGGTGDAGGMLPDKPSAIVHSASSPPRLVRALLSIKGMTCSSCVGNITEALQNKTRIRSVEVNLLTSSASVILDGKEHLKDVTDAVEDVGYGATVEEWEDIHEPERSDLLPTTDTWRASYAIGGMSCSSCVGSITNALESFNWVKAVDINLISNSATVVFEGKSHLGQIAENIEDVGYDAKLASVDDLSHSQQQGLRRTVAIRVAGVYCDHCPSRIQDALRVYGDRVEIEKPLTRADPILKIKYVPHAPEFTIRHILTSISATDPALQVSVYHPPTLEERSRKLRARQQRRILLRVGLSITVAIPTLVIGIVFMSLVPSSNTNRQYLMRPMWSGRVSRAEWALFIMASPVYFFAADLFHRRAAKELRTLWRPGSKTPILRRFYRFGSMDMLMSLGISIAYFSSIVEIAIGATQPPDSAPMKSSSTYFDAVVFLALFLLIGRLIEAYSKSRAGDAVTMLGKLRPTEAILVDHSGGEIQDEGFHSGQGTRQIHVDLLEYGDVVRVLQGGSPPCDGIVLEGESKFDESSLTGESSPVGKSMGDEVFAGTVNEGGPISVRISGVSGASMLDQIVNVVREGQTRRAPIERVIDVLTSYFVPIVTLIAVSVWIIWLSLGLSGVLPESYLDVSVGGWPFWSLQFAIAVFVIACPCGIGLAAPTALFVGGGLAAQHGILVKGGGEAFQEASDLDCIVFDKTGTLTQGGEPAITDHQFVSSEDPMMVLGMAKRLEESSSHPIAKAVVSFCNARETQDVQPTSMEEIAGKGMRGYFVTKTTEGQEIEAMIGNEALMLDSKVDVLGAIIASLDAWKAQGKSVALVAMRYVPRNALPIQTMPTTATTWNLAAIFAVADPVRPEASNVIRALRDRDVDVWMISGDNPVTAYAVGDMVGIPRANVIAGVLPGQKAEKIKYLQQSLKKLKAKSVFGRKREYSHRRATVAMVGDGINDSPALTVADVGIAIGSGSDIAISSAEFVLISSGLNSLLTLIDLSRTVFIRIKFNFGWALVYNIIALPVAAGVLYPIKSKGGHVRLDPVWASVAMALSSVSVVCSSLLLRSGLPVVGFRPDRRS